MSFIVFFLSRRRHTRCALVTGVQTCALPIYNAQDTLVRAVNSALGQQVPVEVLIIDDASSDDTPRVAEGLARLHHNVRLIVSAENGGPSVARNRGLADAQGEWNAILEAVSTFLTGRLQRRTRESGRREGRER